MSDSTAGAPRRGMGVGAKLGLGCGIGCLTLLVITGVVGYLGVRYVIAKIDGFKRELVARGFEEQPAQQLLEVRDEITRPVLLVGQFVRVYGDCHTNVAILAQVAEIHGTIAGDVYFRGQVLTISPKGHVHGDVDVYCQAVNIQGTVDGEVRGTWLERQ
ncbi:MAG: polymer-forming cytoskeletal protein [bacterium]|nr:polymer-forming cytoskeletal protein [bacterium]